MTHTKAVGQNHSDSVSISVWCIKRCQLTKVEYKQFFLVGIFWPNAHFVRIDIAAVNHSKQKNIFNKQQEVKDLLLLVKIPNSKNCETLLFRHYCVFLFNSSPSHPSSTFRIQSTYSPARKRRFSESEARFAERPRLPRIDKGRVTSSGPMSTLADTFSLCLHLPRWDRRTHPD